MKSQDFVNQKAVILVAAHKPTDVYTNDIYVPIHVGRIISKFKEEMADMIGDDTGENISEKNKSYCELTATFWAWKNLRNVEYIGLCHYRRYFETVITEKNIDLILNHYDVILPKPYLHDHALEYKLYRTLLGEDVVILLKTIRILYPDYEQDVIDYLYDYVDIPYNMFVMKRNIFEKYSEFVFSILEGCEKMMRDLPYTCSSRRMGYIAEYLLPIYCFHNHLCVKYDNVVSMIGEKAPSVSVYSECKQKIKIRILKYIYRKVKPTSFEKMYYDAYIVGLRNDGIIDGV